ncbi:uncharacterized protein LOC126966495 isoform X1 [Leptidea sinapis]|uniref:uncharacterized protein LOC126966495 isoform X1 n=3 Tax=Leptidea sinapis TaxID=189913 RepID=UPI00212F2E70|nr:uncharacterized protein LOC126966495 isoform X1 [Leptidea sinapis]
MASNRRNKIKYIYCITGLLLIILYLYYFYMFVDSSKHHYRYREYNTNTSNPFYIKYNESEDYLINTPGCSIPNFGRTLNFKEAEDQGKSCGDRAIFVYKLSNEYLTFRIDDIKMRIYSKGKWNYQCCYQFIKPKNKSNDVDYRTIERTGCEPFKNMSKIELKEEIIVVSCYIHNENKNTTIYEDAYILVKRLSTQKEVNANVSGYNILILGMDTMSRVRFIRSMPRTYKYLKENDWLDFRAYNKVDYNTFPNIVALLTGKKRSEVTKLCNNTMDTCNDIFLWSLFNKKGYYTAFGEDYLRLPDTFTLQNGFKVPPTNHYPRPLFITGESLKGNLICTMKKPSAQHLLDYALDFSIAYKSNNFFGMFWLNSYSHNLQNIPTLIDRNIVNFFESMDNSGILKNTFVFFLSDHGIRFGEARMPYESYYDERLPMLYIQVPDSFRKTHTHQYTNMVINQGRLLSPYDLYLTMSDLLHKDAGTYIYTLDACPQCVSILKELSPDRNCADASIDAKWCTCHDMTKLPNDDKKVLLGVSAAMAIIQKKNREIITTKCTECEILRFKKVLRAHIYTDSFNTRVYYIIVLLTTPGDLKYEVVVEKQDTLRVIEPIDTISTYNSKGNCVVHLYDRTFCICKIKKKCKIKP